VIKLVTELSWQCFTLKLANLRLSHQHLTSDGGDSILSKTRQPGLWCVAVCMILHLVGWLVEHRLVTQRQPISTLYSETKIIINQNRWLLRHSNWLISFSCDLLLMCCASVAYNGSTVYCWKKLLAQNYYCIIVIILNPSWSVLAFYVVSGENEMHGIDEQKHNT